jgi:hypothetical protein
LIDSRVAQWTPQQAKDARRRSLTESERNDEIDNGEDGSEDRDGAQRDGRDDPHSRLTKPQVASPQQPDHLTTKTKARTTTTTTATTTATATALSSITSSSEDTEESALSPTTFHTSSPPPPPPPHHHHPHPHHRTSSASNLNNNPNHDNSNTTINGQQILNQRAVAVINRVSNKLSGRDFNTEGPISVPEQVERLIQQATSHDNLCQCYIGWCPFW